MRLLVETAGDPLRLAGSVRAAIAAIDSSVPVLEISTLGLLVRQSTYNEEVSATMVSTLSGVALFLSAIGLYGVLAYTTVRRTREIGIRMALGAQRADALRMVLGDGLRLAAIGIAVGTAGGLAITPALGKALYGVSPRDPLTFAAVAALMIAVALAASYVPARRATRVDPLEAVRCE
jgi:ABC-type antimicrobial peptide transport system permease subunit